MAPADYCPFERPFTPGFSACGCFAPERYIGQSLRFVPAAAVSSCSNLRIARVPGSPGTHYGACAIGDLEARKRCLQPGPGEPVSEA